MMKNILIVDDNKTNRFVLKECIASFLKDEQIEDVKILEAVDGVEAVEIVDKEDIDIIFMDIMMPRKDGIEATSEIKAKNKKVMIIAVSALDDDFNKQKILKAGAEDYIVKPINNDVIKKRLSQYRTILESRTIKRVSSDPINILNHFIYSRRTIFLISGDGSLAEFWDFWLSRTKDNNEIVDLVRVLYGLGAWQLKLKYKFEIVIEENDEEQYFTMTNMKLLNGNIVSKVIEKNYPEAIFKLDGDKLSFKISKKGSLKIETKKEVEEVATKVETPRVIKEEIVFKHEPKEEELFVYDFIEEEDVSELESIASELQSMMLLVGSSKLEQNEIMAIATYIEKFSRILSQYPETYDLYLALSALSKDITENISSFMEKSKDIATLCVAFNNDLFVWLKKLFSEGAPSVDFLDNSIISNANMISSFIKPSSGAVESIDDIFDF